ncbi:hypothetical protein H0H81_004012 [Sphagnurus paluster]|uniref:Uncharacterized protein n=1 Tax=Sphagnurus paluster TaxID=117069 RepID=A0A9P7GMT9_9AGAR|nr:hypothetical protein H0H81_004012 [Sphagnurus paluster]
MSTPSSQQTKFSQHIGATNTFVNPSFTLRLLSSIARAANPRPTAALNAMLKRIEESLHGLKRMAHVTQDEMLRIEASLTEVRHVGTDLDDALKRTGEFFRNLERMPQASSGAAQEEISSMKVSLVEYVCYIDADHAYILECTKHRVCHLGSNTTPYGYVQSLTRSSRASVRAASKSV